MIGYVLTYLVALPVSVWLLAHLLSLLDVQTRSPVLTRLGLGALLLTVFLLMTNRDLWQAIAAAFCTVTVLHGAAAWWIRSRALGARIEAEED